MNKAGIKSPEKPYFRASAFTLTFAIEILDIEIWHDFKEGSLDLENYSQALKIQYNLNPGNTFDVDVLIWPHCAKIWCESNAGWVRTWQFLERRWLCFSISHLVPVRVRELSQHMLTVTPNYGSGALGTHARSDKNDQVYIPRMKFGERRYFAPVIPPTEGISMAAAVREMIWKAVEDHIPACYLDGTFNTPQPVSDVRHQDAVLYYVREIILNRNKSMEDVYELDRERELSKQNAKKATIKTPAKADRKFEIKLSGDTVLAGTGRIVPFEVLGESPQGQGEIVALISSANLPAQDDAPIVFVNVDKLLQIPLEVLRGARVSEIYTLWRLGAEERKSVPQKIKNNNEITINDHHSVPLCQETGCSIVAAFLDTPLEIELRGIRLQPVPEKPAIFGYHKKDRDFDKIIHPQRDDDDLDIIIAVCRVDAKSLANGLNGLVRGEYPLYPPRLYIEPLQREATCTNDINAINAQLEPKLLIPAHVILEVQMSLEVSIGLVGCKLPKMTNCYSRLFCAIPNQVPAVALLEEIALVNEQLVEKKQRKDVLTGFAVDTGELLLVIVEGPTDGQILRVWEMTEDYFPEIRPLFSTSSRYSSRVYPEMVMYSTPVYVLKMQIPLNLLLACPSVYVRPAVPIPARNAILKLGRMLSGGLRSPPNKAETPTLAEMRSFRLECCSPLIEHPMFNISPILPVRYNHERKNFNFSTSGLDK